jgi:hypothetical protein
LLFDMLTIFGGSGSGGGGVTGGVICLAVI